MGIFKGLLRGCFGGIFLGCMVVEGDKIREIIESRKLLGHLKGYALCRRARLSGRGLCGGGYAVLAQLPC